MITLKSLGEAERFVTRQKRLGNDIRWENYDIVFFRVAPNGRTSKHGAFKNGQWGFENRASVSASGTWEIDRRDIRRAQDHRGRNN